VACHPSFVCGSKPMSRIAIFIDGAYLGFLLKDEFKLTKIRYDALAGQMANPVPSVG